jgi:hypothetical protein
MPSPNLTQLLARKIITMDTVICYIEQFPHRLPHDREAVLLPCGHYACPPHTITYYGTGDDDELVGDYCMVCYARTFPQHCPDRLLLEAVLQEAEH